MKVIKSPEEFELLVKGTSETIKNGRENEKNEDFVECY